MTEDELPEEAPEETVPPPAAGISRRIRNLAALAPDLRATPADCRGGLTRWTNRRTFGSDQPPALLHLFEPPDGHVGSFGWLCGYSADAFFLGCRRGTLHPANAGGAVPPRARLPWG